MLKIFARLFGDKPEQNTITTEYGKQENGQENQEKKENEIMAKAKENTKATTNKATENKEETTMKTAKTTATKGKATTKTSAKAKGETTMKATERKTSTKATAKAKGETTMKTKMMTATINGIEVTGTQEQIMAIIAACAKANEVKELSTTKATATKGKTTSKKATESKAETKATKGKSSAKKTATAKAKAETKTWTEKKAEYAKQFTDEEKAEYGFRKSLERKATKFAYETTNAKFEERVAKKEWNKVYKEILGFLMNAIEELASESEAYTDEEVVRDFLGTVADKGIKKVRSDVKGYAKYVRA